MSVLAFLLMVRGAPVGTLVLESRGASAARCLLFGSGCFSRFNLPVTPAPYLSAISRDKAAVTAGSPSPGLTWLCPYVSEEVTALQAA